VLNRLANFFVRVVERRMPDPFLFCVLLTVFTYLLTVARLLVRDIMGYCVMTWLLSTALSMLVLWILV